MNGWIAVDLDGTLADYSEWKGPEHIGAPIPLMIERVKTWLAEGKDVRIFTARIAHDEDGSVAAVIEQWCEEHLGVKLAITNQKDYGMVELWDDRCVQVIPNTGRRVDESASAVPAGEATNWRAELLALAELDCLNEDGAKGDDQYSCNRECVTCCARRAVERLAAPQVLPTRAETDLTLDAVPQHVRQMVRDYCRNDISAAQTVVNIVSALRLTASAPAGTPVGPFCDVCGTLCGTVTRIQPCPKCAPPAVEATAECHCVGTDARACPRHGMRLKWPAVEARETDTQTDQRFEDRRTMTVRLSLTDAQWSAVETLLAKWNWLGSAGASRWTAFFADGDGNFQPRATVNGREPVATALIPDEQFWTGDEWRIDFDSIAWPLHEATARSTETRDKP